MNNSSTLQPTVNDLWMGTNNSALHPESDSGDDIALDANTSDNDRRHIPKHMLGKNYNFPQCQDTAVRGRRPGG